MAIKEEPKVITKTEVAGSVAALIALFGIPAIIGFCIWAYRKK